MFEKIKELVFSNSQNIDWLLKLKGKSLKKQLKTIKKNIQYLNYQNQSDGHSLLMLCVNAHPDLVKPILEFGADINLKDNKGCTALMHSLNGYSYTKMVELLLQNGADINAKDNDGHSPLIIATLNNNKACILALLKYNPNLYISANLSDVFDIALQYDYTDLYDILTSHKESLNLKKTIANKPAKKNKML